jgi:hypothetical protein
MWVVSPPDFRDCIVRLGFRDGLSHQAIPVGFIPGSGRQGIGKNSKTFRCSSAPLMPNRKANCPVQLGDAMYSGQVNLPPLLLSSWIFKSGGTT